METHFKHLEKWFVTTVVLQKVYGKSKTVFAKNVNGHSEHEFFRR